MKPKLPSLTAAAVLAAFSCPALADPPGLCDQHGTIIDFLKTRYGEQLVGRGLGGLPIVGGAADDGALIELTVDPRGGTWSLLLTAPGGQTCLLGRGAGWEFAKPAPAGRDG